MSHPYQRAIVAPGTIVDHSSTNETLDLWAAQPPAPDAFLSTTPFFADTMVFSQWLQWVFIPRFRALLDGGHALPAQCDIAPLAEEALRGLDQPTEPLIELLRRFDGHF